MRLLIVGDWHGNHQEVQRSYQRARDRSADVIVQVGDFGYWEHADDGAFLDYIEEWFDRTGIATYWIDGNHENHTMLRSVYDVKPGHFTVVRPGCYYIPRGTKWEWDGVTFMGVGGAVSIDKEYRLNRERGLPSPEWGQPEAKPATGPGTMWWPEEQLTDEELEFVKSQGTADVLFTHDCPTNAPFYMRLKNDIDSQIHRQKMNEVGKSVQPKYWFHGHMHEFYDYSFRHDGGEATVIGLECDGMKNNWVLMDTEIVHHPEWATPVEEVEV
jgi:Icc-related predicted phosphoesterase